jgi:hypothetical protein
MNARKPAAEVALARLQRVAKLGVPKGEVPAGSVALTGPAEGRLLARHALPLSSATIQQVRAAAEVIVEDERFEYLPKPEEALREFVRRAATDLSEDYVPWFVASHARVPQDLICYLDVEYLNVPHEVEILGIRLLSPDDPTLPAIDWLDSVRATRGCVAAVPVRGTSNSKMAERAHVALEHTLRIMRVGWADVAHVDLLRFRPGPHFAFDAQTSSWQRRPGDPWDLTVSEKLLEHIGLSPVWELPLSPRSDIEKRALRAVAWMERSRLSTDNLVSLLYLFIALEALLGDESEGLKADMLAFRQMALSHIDEGSFAHPNKTWALYDQVRSTAVHGEEDPVVTASDLYQFEWSTRNTLSAYLRLATARGFTKRRQLTQALERDPSVPELAAWLHDNAGTDWDKYTGKLIPPSTQH